MFGYAAWPCLPRLLLLLQASSLLVQIVPPSPGKPEDAPLVSAFLLGEANAAITVAGTRPSERDPEEKPVGSLARARASDGNAGHGRSRKVQGKAGQCR
jgi:hypothetical protein